MNWEPLFGETTTNPKLGDTEAVTLPLAILLDTNDSILSADSGILNNPSPLPLKNPEPDGITIFPLTNKLPVNVEPLNADSTINPKLGDTDAVTLPLAIRNTSSDNAERGISNNPLPLPLNIDAETGNWNVENVLTTNPVLGAIEAVAEPLAILGESSVMAERGISNNPLPLPLNIEADTGNWKVENVLTTNPVFGAIDAVVEPLAINVAVNAGRLNKPLPSPRYSDADIEPLISTLPVNSEPLTTDSTLNPKSGDTEAVIEPVDNLVACGKLNKSLPSPKNEPVNEPLNEPVACANPINEPVKLPAIVEPDITFAFNLSLTSTEPVNCCISDELSPNTFEPDE